MFSRVFFVFTFVFEEVDGLFGALFQTAAVVEMVLIELYE